MIPSERKEEIVRLLSKKNIYLRRNYIEIYLSV